MKKIYYIPGLISAVLIPILFWYYGNQKFEQINISVIDIGLPIKLDKNKKNYDYTFESIRNWNYKKIKVAPGRADQESKSYVSELKNLQKRNVKESGIEFILGQHNTYGDFVSILNDLHIARQEEYAIDMDKTGSIFAVYSYKDPNAKQPEYECLLCNDTIDLTASSVDTFESPIYGKIFNAFTSFPKEACYMIFGFLLFLNISMLSIKERFQM